jgi:hypothetical protein
MEPDSTSPHPLIRALKLAALLASISIVGFALLGFSMLYLPENYFLRDPGSSIGKDWRLYRLRRENEIDMGLWVGEARPQLSSIPLKTGEPDWITVKDEIPAGIILIDV